MRPIQRLLSGMIVGGGLTGLASIILDGFDSFIVVAIGGAIISAAIGAVVVTTLYLIPTFLRPRILYSMLGVLLGGLGFIVANSLGIHGGGVIDNTMQGLIIGAVIGMVVSLTVSAPAVKRAR